MSRCSSTLVRDLRRREGSEEARSLSAGRGKVLVVVVAAMVGAAAVVCGLMMDLDGSDFGDSFVFLEESSISADEAASAAWAEDVGFFAFLGERGLLIFER